MIEVLMKNAEESIVKSSPKDLLQVGDAFPNAMMTIWMSQYQHDSFGEILDDVKKHLNGILSAIRSIEDLNLRRDFQSAYDKMYAQYRVWELLHKVEADNAKVDKIMEYDHDGIKFGVLRVLTESDEPLTLEELTEKLSSKIAHFASEKTFPGILEKMVEFKALDVWEGIYSISAAGSRYYSDHS